MRGSQKGSQACGVVVVGLKMPMNVRTYVSHVPALH